MTTTNMAAPHFRMVILAPPAAIIPGVITKTLRDPVEHERVLAAMQHMRGRVAVREGAVKVSDLHPGRRHCMPGDENSWHLLRLGPDNSIQGCARLLIHPHTATFPELRLASSAVAHHPRFGGRVRSAVEVDLSSACEQKINIVEPGGWVLEEALRGTSEAILIALSAFAWARLIGACVAYVTATVKHRSSSMLRRLGAEPLYFGGEEIPKYYDRVYGCEMELLRIRSAGINHRFERRISWLHDLLLNAPVLQAGPLTRCAAA